LTTHPSPLERNPFLWLLCHMMLSSTCEQQQANWTRSDRYHNSFLLSDDPVLSVVQQKSIEEGLPAIAVSPAQGKLLQLLARSINAKRILEVGTLGGYSTIWLARAVPSNGEVVTLELERKHAEVAERNIALAGAAGLSWSCLGQLRWNWPRPCCG
jgi:predicted O-methyltransferase YrrM